MTIHATIDVIAFDADVIRIRTAVPPPLGWSEQPDNRSAGRDRQMSRPRVATDVNLRAFCEGAGHRRIGFGDCAATVLPPCA